jgi:hypothetical protein
MGQQVIFFSVLVWLSESVYVYFDVELGEINPKPRDLTTDRLQTIT